MVIFRSTSLKLGSLYWKLYADFINGLNLENPITRVCRPLSPVFKEGRVDGRKNSAAWFRRESLQEERKRSLIQVQCTFTMHITGILQLSF